MNFKRALLSIGLISFGSVAAAPYGAAETPRVTWGGFIDGQYAYDFNTPPNGDRSFTTQPARSDEFNINLAFVEGKIDAEKLRARLALQAGTSVQSNYSSEPNLGTVSGGDLARHIQEARAGYKISDNTWIDAGIFFAHVGSESFISRDNLTLTRSLVADFSPYYLSGAKLTHEFSKALTLQLLVTNGWQNISENNRSKNVGTGIEYKADSWSLAYNTLLGQEVSSPLNGTARGSQFRHYHNVLLKNLNAESLEWVAQFDIGFQKKPNEDASSTWSGASLMARYALNPSQKIALRAEYFQDLDQIIIVTGAPNAFSGYGGSIGFDQSLDAGLVWRTEARVLKADKDVFPKENAFASENITLTTSWALSF